MKQFYTVVLDRLTTFQNKLNSEPYEAGWADEVVAFVRVEEMEKNSVLSAKLQISPDGINWIDEGSSILEIMKEGVFFMRTVNFGGWLRLSLECNKKCKVTTYLALKG